MRTVFYASRLCTSSVPKLRCATTALSTYKSFPTSAPPATASELPRAKHVPDSAFLPSSLVHMGRLHVAAFAGGGARHDNDTRSWLGGDCKTTRRLLLAALMAVWVVWCGSVWGHANTHVDHCGHTNIGVSIPSYSQTFSSQTSRLSLQARRTSNTRLSPKNCQVTSLPHEVVATMVSEDVASMNNIIHSRPLPRHPPTQQLSVGSAS